MNTFKTFIVLTLAAMLGACGGSSSDDDSGASTNEALVRDACYAENFGYEGRVLGERTCETPVIIGKFDLYRVRIDGHLEEATQMAPNDPHYAYLKVRSLKPVSYGFYLTPDQMPTSIPQVTAQNTHFKTSSGEHLLYQELDCEKNETCHAPDKETSPDDYTKYMEGWQILVIQIEHDSNGNVTVNVPRWVEGATNTSQTTALGNVIYSGGNHLSFVVCNIPDRLDGITEPEPYCATISKAIQFL